MRGSDECWTLGDEALRAEPVGRSGPRGGVVGRLEALANEIGVPPKTLRIYRGIAWAWPKTKRRKSLPFGVHAVFRSEPDRYELIRQEDWTTATARAFLKQRRLDKG